jgi:hypothetical protein
MVYGNIKDGFSSILCALVLFVDFMVLMENQN